MERLSAWMFSGRSADPVYRALPTIPAHATHEFVTGEVQLHGRSYVRNEERHRVTIQHHLGNRRSTHLCVDVTRKATTLETTDRQHAIHLESLDHDRHIPDARGIEGLW